MSRLLVIATTLVALAAAGCHREPAPVAPGTGDLPPLPPSSGTPVGYLLDNAAQLQLTTEQHQKLERIDDSLSARNEAIDTQLREIERPEEMPEPKKGEPPPKMNMAPGAMPMTTTADAPKLHAAKDANTREALQQAFALLDSAQQQKAKQLLDERGIKSPPVAPPAAPGPGDAPAPAPAP